MDTQRHDDSSSHRRASSWSSSRSSSPLGRPVLDELPSDSSSESDDEQDSDAIDASEASDAEDDSFLGCGEMIPHPVQDLMPVPWSRALAAAHQDAEDGEHGQRSSFLESPETLWEEPLVETVLSHLGNVRTYYYYGSGKIIQDQDLSACLSSSPLPPGPEWTSVTQRQPEGPTTIQPFTCCTARGCHCGRPASSLPSTPPSVYGGPLPSDDHIRLLEILPGTGPGLECRLHVGRLPQDQYTYEALSYTWVLRTEYGCDMEDKAWIKCNGAPLEISLNLAGALHRLRNTDTSRIMWADALCINQGDLAERSHQVSRMKSIYENAFRLVIWLEPLRVAPYEPVPPIHLRPSYKAFSAVCSVVNDWRVRAGFADVVPEASHTHHYSRPSSGWNHDILTSDSSKWSAIFDLFERRWFSRLWVVQEVVLARSAQVVWDEAEILWEYIGLAAAIIRANYDRIATEIRKGPSQPFPHFGPSRRVPMGVVNAYFMFRLCRSQVYSEPLQFSFYELLKLTRQFECKDDRDRVYGLLGLPTTDGLGSHIEPDYAKSAGEVYFDVASKMIDREGPAILSSVQRKHRRGRMRMYYVPRWAAYDWTVPSWVPQWSFLLTQSLCPPRRSCSTGFRASGDRPCSRQTSDDPRELILGGIIVDTVTRCDYTSFNAFWRGTREADEKHDTSRRWTGPQQQRRVPDLGEMLDDARLTRQHLVAISLNLTGGQNWYGLPVEDEAAHLADFCRCLVKDGLRWSLGMYGGGGGRKRGLGDEQQGDNAIHVVGLEELEKLSAGGNADRFLDLAATACSRRAKIETAEGLVGLGPEATKEGDLLCVLYGADMPFIIRKKEAGHVLVGECYVRDLMRGQAVDGTIPRFSKPLAEAWIVLV